MACSPCSKTPTKATACALNRSWLGQPSKRYCVSRAQSPPPLIGTLASRCRSPGVEIGPGEVVLGAFTSANRDEFRFDGADRFDIGRDPNKHLTFGQGGHYCVGAPLARLEGKIALNALLAHFADIRLATPTTNLPWRPGMVLRGLEHLPVRTKTVTLPRDERTQGEHARTEGYLMHRHLRFDQFIDFGV